MKQIARSYFFWPGINRDVERVVEACEGCGQNQQHPAKTILHNWKWPKEVFSRIHIDYLGGSFSHYKYHNEFHNFSVI
jgi:hypothetical protein